VSGRARINRSLDNLIRSLNTARRPRKGATPEPCARRRLECSLSLLERAVQNLGHNRPGYMTKSEHYASRFK
jgi:hypothetical protein